MNPDKKYMSQVKTDNSNIKFIPPSFVDKKLRDDVNSSINNDLNFDLFPSETGLPKLCYYSSEFDNYTNRNDNINIANVPIPTTFDALRGLDLDLDEIEDLDRSHSDNDIKKIYLKIEKSHPGIFETLYSYRIPRPIVRVIVKRLIRLTLSYCDKEKRC